MPKSRKRKQKKRTTESVTRQSDQDYVDGKVDLYDEVTRPSYEDVMGWMQCCEGRNVAFDFWARGNYTRRLIYHRNQGIEPLLVRVTYVDEIRWAYRRLALLGLPVDFVFCGDITEPTKLVHVSRREAIWDSGWGYNAAQWKDQGRYCAAIFGTARLLPETVVDWLVEEASDDFLDGRVLVAPAELIGISKQRMPEGLSKLASITKGAPLTSNYEIARAAMELDIPFLDNMNSLRFKTFVRDYEGELMQFRRAFRNLVTVKAKSEDRLKECVEELKYEIAELTKAAKYQGARNSISKLGGILATFTASFALAVNAQPNSMYRLLGGAGIAAATKALLDLYTQAIEREKNLADNPYFILWKLGVSRPSEVKAPSTVEVIKAPKLSPEQFGLDFAYHWLCPPTNGVWFGGVRKAG